MVDKRFFSVLAVAFALTACGGGEGGEGGEIQESDTTAVSGTDTMNVPTVVPTTDSVVQTTTVETDTIRTDAQQQGGTQDTTRRP